MNEKKWHAAMTEEIDKENKISYNQSNRIPEIFRQNKERRERPGGRSTGKMKKNGFTKILVLLLALVLAAAVPMQAYAAKKTVTATTSKKTAKAVKTGKQTVKIKPRNDDSKAGAGYVKFTANKTKTYKFYFKNVRTSRTKKVIMSGNVSFYDKHGDGITFEQDGEEGQYTLWLTSKYSYSIGVDDGEFIPSRKASIKLEKGQTIYIRLYYSAVKKRGNGLFDLTIK